MNSISRISEQARRSCFLSYLSRAILGLVLLMVWLTPLLAEAANPKKATALNAKAIKAYKGKQYLKAIDLWLQATEFADGEQLIKLHKNLGLALHRLERHAEAWYHLTVYMQRADKADAKVARKIKESEDELKKLNVKVSVSSMPPGAIAILPPGDRMHRLKTPFSWWLPPGEYAVKFVKDGYVSSREVLRVKLEGAKHFDIVLKQAPRTGVLKLAGKAAGSSVRVNGKVQGPLPYLADLEPGKYELEVYYADGQMWKGSADIQAGKTTEMMVQVGSSGVMRPETGGKGKKTRSQAWKWATIGAGVAIAGVGGVMSGMAVKNMDEYDTVNSRFSYLDSPGHVDYESKYLPAYNAIWEDKIAPFLNASYALYAVGGAAVAVGIVALLIPSGDSSTESAESFYLLPSLVPGQAGLDFGFRF